MKRGGFGNPYRPPARAGWPARLPPYPDMYRHKQAALNNIPKYVNTTLAAGSRPQMRYDSQLLTTNCVFSFPDGNPREPWIGLDGNQGLPPFLATGGYAGNVFKNTYQLNGTNSLGLNCRQTGFKNVQAVRQFHGCFGFLTKGRSPHLDGVVCQIPVCDTCDNPPPGQMFDCGVPPCSWSPGYCDTYELYSFDPYNSVPDQRKYLTVTYSDITYSSVSYDSDCSFTTINSSASGRMSVDANSSKLTGQLSTSGKAVNTDNTGVSVTAYDIVNGYDRDTTNKNGTPIWADGILSNDWYTVLCPGAGDVGAFIKVWNNGQCGTHPADEFNSGPWPMLPEISTGAGGYNSYNASLSASRVNVLLSSPDFPPVIDHIDIQISWSRTDDGTTSVLTWQYHIEEWTSPDPNRCTGHSSIDLGGTVTLSNPHLASSIYTDVNTLLGYWDLTDDGQYPFRTDGIWQVAPLVTRDEGNGPVSPLGFFPHYLDDYRSPTGSTPYSRWGRMDWFDQGAYGFQFAAGKDQTSAAALSWRQYALTGKICGMPLPRALTDPDSYHYDPGQTFPAGHLNFQNFFDYRAEVWKACKYSSDGGVTNSVIWYHFGNGQWCYDAIEASGAQLPHGCTQWTPNHFAFEKPPFAWLVYADRNQYVAPDGTGPPTSVFNQGLFAQKCCVIMEVWPSQNFARPAGADKFALDETQVYCFDGTTLTNLDGSLAAGLTKTGIWGGASGDGCYNGFTTDAGGVITLGTKVSALPSDWGTSSGAAFSATGAFGKMRWFSVAKPVLGRMNVTAVDDLGPSRRLTTGPLTTLGLGTTPDTVDIFDAAMVVLASGVAVTRVSDTQFTVSTALATLAPAAWIVSHGAAAYQWDDNGRKGDFCVFDWTLDYRRNAEVARLAGVLDCANYQAHEYWQLGGSVGADPGHAPPAGSPAANCGYASFNQTQYEGSTGAAFSTCKPYVVCLSPNGEAFANGQTIAFPATFVLDELYGSRWQAEIEQSMSDLLWQAPHQPCNFSDLGELGGSRWIMDDGTCREDDTPDIGDIYYAHVPMVEARLRLPSGAPDLPTGITMGYTGCVGATAPTLAPPGMIGFDPLTGSPVAAWTDWGYRQSIEVGCPPDNCKFNYVGMENLNCQTIVGYNPPSDGA